MRVVAGMEASAYGPAAVPEAILLEWHAANPNGFSVVANAEGEVVGHLNLLPIRPGPLRSFIDGLIHDYELRGDSLHPPADREQVRDLYLESIMIQVPEREARRSALAHLLGHLERLVDRVADPARVENVYAIVASEAGRRLLSRLGFVPFRTGADRVDGLDLVRADRGDLLGAAGKIA